MLRMPTIQIMPGCIALNLHALLLRNGFPGSSDWQTHQMETHYSETAPMVETDKSALDTAMYKEIDTLTTRQKVFLPLHIDGWTTGGPSIRGVEY